MIQTKQNTNKTPLHLLLFPYVEFLYVMVYAPADEKIPNVNQLIFLLNEYVKPFLTVMLASNYTQDQPISKINPMLKKQQAQQVDICL